MSSNAAVALCGDDELGYSANRTRFAPGEPLRLDENYRLAHLPLVAPDHPSVIARKAGRPYENGRHPRPVISLSLPVPDEVLQRSDPYRALEAELRASPIGAKIAWDIVERRRDRLHATIAGSITRGETLTALDASRQAALRDIGPFSVELRGLFSGNINVGRLYLRLYPEKRDGNVLHRMQRVMGCPETSLYLVGLYNLVDDLDAAEASTLAALLDRWWDVPLARFEVEAIRLMGATDDLALDTPTMQPIPLRAVP